MYILCGTFLITYLLLDRALCAQGAGQFGLYEDGADRCGLATLSEVAVLLPPAWDPVLRLGHEYGPYPSA